MNQQWKYETFENAVEICDSLRKPINNTERQKRTEGKSKSSLYPYYGATGQVGYIDDYITDGEFVLLGEDGAPFLNPFASKAYIIHGKTWVNNHAHVLKSKTNNSFLCYYLNQFNYKGYVSGTTRLKLTQGAMKRMSIPVPPLPEQERIVSRIEELFSQLDDGMETLKKTKEQLEVYRQAVLEEAFLNCTDTVYVEDVCEYVTDGDHMPPPKAESGIPFIMISNVTNNIINWDDTAFVGHEYYEKINDKRKPKKGDVLYTVTGSYGIPILIDYNKKFCFQRHIALLRPNESIQQKFLYYAMMTPQVYAQATKGATGTAQRTVGLGVLRKIKIPYTPNQSAQSKIVDNIECSLSVCNSIEQMTDNALVQANALKQSILKKAFEGRL